MNLFPSPTASPSAGAEWKMEIEISDSGLTSQCTAVICRNGQKLCHLSMTSESLNREQAHMELAEKARAWIAEYQQRGVSQ